MEFRVLGPLEVTGPRGPITIRSALQRAALAVLVLHIGETVSSDRLIDELWGDDPPRGARHALEVHLSGLRRVLGAQLIDTQPSGYRLRAEDSSVDLDRFEALVADASRELSEGDPRIAAEGFAAALALWRGPALGDLATGGAARAERARLDELRALTLERRVDAELACGRHTDAIPELRRIVGEMPLREGFQARLMLALYRSGRQAEALEVYTNARRALDLQLGVEPGAELEALQQAILNHDSKLMVRPLPFSPGQEAPAAASTESAPVSSHAGRTVSQREKRRTVTTLMADLTGSTLLGQPLDPESARDPAERWLDEMRAVVTRHGGTIEKLPAGAVMAVFGVPTAHEDDGLRAVRAAAEMRTAVAALNTSFGRELALRVDMRVGLNTGDVVTGDPTASASLVTGHAVNVAARLEQAAAPGEILLGERTYRLVRDAVDVSPAASIEIRGWAAPISAYALLGVTGLDGHRPRVEGVMVGREGELAALREILERAQSGRSSQLVTILGAAGVGKSRLAAEFVGALHDRARVVRGRCLAYGDGITYRPVAEIVRQIVGIEDGDPAPLAQERIQSFVLGLPEAGAVARGLMGIVGLETSAFQDELFWSFRRSLEHLARDTPLVMVVEDIHWAEPTLLDLLESIADLTHDAPIVLVCPARPELLDDRPTWGGGRRNATTIFLEPLADDRALQLLDSLMPGAQLPAAVRSRVAEAAEGNPLYLEEFLALLIDGGSLASEGDGWARSRDLDSIAMPPTIEALLAARLDRLASDESAVAERAAVVGRVFDEPSVLALSPPESRAAIHRSLVALVRRDVIRPDRSSPFGGESYRFRHALIRDAAYERLPKAERAELHERFAAWLDGTAGDRVSELDALIGLHLEHAYRLRTELGPVDDRSRELARRAAQRLIAAGRRAGARSDFAATVNLLGRGAAVLEPADPIRLRVLPDLGRALAFNGRADEARAFFVEAVERSEATGDTRTLALARVLRELSVNEDVELSASALHRQAAESVAVFEQFGDDRGLALAWRLDGSASRSEGRLAQQEVSLMRALRHARRADDHLEETLILYNLGGGLALGPMPVPMAIRRCREILDRSPDDRAIEMAMSHALAHLFASLGEFDVARPLAARCRQIAAENGELSKTALLAEVEWEVETTAGNLELAHQIIAEGCAQYADIGEPSSPLEPALALSQVSLGFEVDVDRLDRARVGAEASLLGRLEVARASAEQQMGRTGEAERHARDAVELLAATDLLALHADAAMILGNVLASSGRAADAMSSFESALDLYRRKGHVMGERTAAARLVGHGVPSAHQPDEAAIR